MCNKRYNIVWNDVNVIFWNDSKTIRLHGVYILQALEYGNLGYSVIDSRAFEYVRPVSSTCAHETGHMSKSGQWTYWKSLWPAIQTKEHNCRVHCSHFLENSFSFARWIVRIIVDLLIRLIDYNIISNFHIVQMTSFLFVLNVNDPSFLPFFSDFIVFNVFIIRIFDFIDVSLCYYGY